jgi:DNA polymerase I-like protein with 3'-5' exonuclease and polymerase domains
MKLVLDVENTVTKRNDRLHLDPFETNNSLVMIGMKSELGEQVVTFDHSETEPTPDGQKIVQDMLDKATVLVCHNVSHDLLWLWESGFKYDGIVFDTMLGDYVLQRGQKKPSSLEMCAERYGLETKKQDTLKEYFKKGFSVRDIPHAELSEYLVADLRATDELSDKIFGRLYGKDSGLMNTVSLTNMVAVCLCKIYRNGFAVDYVGLEEVRQEFEKEKRQLVQDLNVQVRELMGDVPINLNSPEQLSWVIYSRKPKDKNDWSSCFDHNMDYNGFKSKVLDKAETIYKKKAFKCEACDGKGVIQKMRKDGKPYARPTKCSTCNNLGFIYKNVGNEVAGLKRQPPNSRWVSHSGFTINKANVEILENMARREGDKTAESFLKKIRRLSAVETYLSSFVEGIADHVKRDGKLHVRLLQHRTSTGRFSGAPIDTLRIKTPSGREFSFPDVERKGNGKVTYGTQIKNYPVQSFATADIVPLVLIRIEEALQNMQSCIVNSVHDSIVIDIHPDEQDQVLKVMKDINKNLKNIVDNHFNIDFNVPLLLESKIGNNWLDTKDVM